MIRLGRVVVLALLAVACATPPQKPPAPLATLPSSWEVRGRLAVNLADEAWHGTFAWRLTPDRQRVELAGPFGQGSARLDEDVAGATLDLGGGEVLHGTDTEALRERQFGWSLPLGGLRHWIGGLGDDGSERVPVGGPIPGAQRRRDSMPTADWSLSRRTVGRSPSNVTARWLAPGPCRTASCWSAMTWRCAW